MSGLFPQLLLVGVAIAANNLAVSLALGSVAPKAVWPRVLMVFALFEFGVPLAGAWLGGHLAGVIADHAAWLGPACLIGLGAATIGIAQRGGPDRDRLARSLTGWGALIALAAGLSTDNLLVGFSMGLSGVPPLALAGTIVTCSVIFAWAGLVAGRRAERNWGRAAAIGSGLILMGLGIAGLFELG
ncbi:manganese efflux pump MntP [Roseovarius sp.]|jgi:putative Mn2+ efflux pump MntP